MPGALALVSWVVLGFVASGWGLAAAGLASDASTNRSRLHSSVEVVRGAVWRGLVAVLAVILVASLVEGGSSLVRPALILALGGVAVGGHYLGRSAWARVAHRVRARPGLSAVIVVAIVGVLGALALLTDSADHDAALESLAEAPFGQWFATLAPLTGMLGSAFSPAPAILGVVALLAMADAGLRLLSSKPEVSRGAGTWVLIVGIVVVLALTGVLAAGDVRGWPADAAAALLAVVALAYVIDFWVRPGATVRDAGSAGFAAAASVVVAPGASSWSWSFSSAVAFRAARHRPRLAAGPLREHPRQGARPGTAVGGGARDAGGDPDGSASVRGSAAGPAAGVHVLVRLADEDLHVERLAGEGGRADADLEGAAARIGAAGADALEDAVGEVVGMLGGAEPQHDELVATPPADQVGHPDGAAHGVAHGRDDPVAHVVPVPVVDLLETVDVEEHGEDRLAVALRHADQLGDALLDAQPVQ